VAPRATNSRDLQHPVQLPTHDVAMNLDVTTSKSPRAQERTSTKISQAGLDDTRTDRSRDGGLERVDAKKGYEET
jgi:hypothetical protein